MNLCRPFTRSERQRTGALLSLLFLLFAVTAAAQEVVSEPADEAVVLFNKGQDAHEKGDLKSALEHYDNAIKLLADFPEAELQRANALRALGRLEEAEKGFRRAGELRPGWAPAIYGLGSLLARRGQFAEADKLLVKAIEIDRANSEAYVSLVEARLRTGAPRDSLSGLLSNIKKITAGPENDASLWTARAALENALGDRTAAKASLSKALELDARNRFALLESANLALLEKDARSAEAYTVRLESVAPATEGTMLLRSRLLHFQGKDAEAIKLLRSVNVPGTETVRFLTALETNASNDPSLLEKKLAEDPKNIVALSKLCTLKRTSDPERALEYCRRASETQPGNIGHAVGFAAALVQAKRYEESVALLRKLAAASPDDPVITANLAAALFQLKRYAEAKPEYRKLLDRDTKQPVVYYFLAICHDQLGEYAEAMANYQQFLRTADAALNNLEIEKVNLRMPILQKQLKEGKGRKNE